MTLLLASLFIPTLAHAETKCPNGSFADTDVNGNIICLDNTKRTRVEPIVTYDQIQINNDQIGYVVIGVIIFIIIVAGIAKASSKPNIESKALSRKGWTEDEKLQVRKIQHGLCKKCDNPPPRWEYDHIDGNRSNNRLSNCQGLCPNCHSIKTNEE